MVNGFRKFSIYTYLDGGTPNVSLDATIDLSICGSLICCKSGA